MAITTFQDSVSSPPTAATESEHILGIDDSVAPFVVPIIAYWIVSIFYETSYYFNWFAAYRVHPTGEEKRRNLVSRWQTLCTVLSIHTVQLIFGFGVARIIGRPKSAPDCGQYRTVEYFGLYVKERIPLVSHHDEVLCIVAHGLQWAWLGLRQLVTFFVFDSWAYWVHYFEHTVPWLYRNIHYVHHHNYVPYSYAASYNHPLEGFFNDVLGSYLSALLVGLSDREATIFFTVATVKAVDDHAGVELPYNPLRLWGWMFGNGMVHHNIHHQAWGLKTNYALYFMFWDRWNNTVYRGKRRLTEAKERQLAKSA